MSGLMGRVADLLEGGSARYPSPRTIAHAIEQRTVDTPALDLLDEVLTRAYHSEVERDKRVIWSMPPQEGKSQRVSRNFPTWLLVQNPDLRIGIASYGADIARRWGRSIRNDIIGHPELGLRIKGDTAAAQEWQLEGYDGGVVTAGVGSALTGRPIDVLIIDDPLKDMEEADSEVIREKVWDWWTSVCVPRLGPGSIVVIVMTRWHEDDLAGRMLAEFADDWTYYNVPARADHDPGKGDTDPLGREPGEYMISARGRTEKEWRARERYVGSRVWLALFQGRPSAQEGNIFLRTWWPYVTPRTMERPDGTVAVLGCDQVAVSVDAAFKDTDGSDYVAVGVWGRRGPKAYLLEVWRERLEFTATVALLRQVADRYPQIAFWLVEEKANGAAIISTLKERLGGIIPVVPTESKEARARAVAPLVEAGDIFLPNQGAWVGAYVDELAGFPNAKHDDQVDMTSQMLNHWFVRGRVDFMAELGRERGMAEDDGARRWDFLEALGTSEAHTFAGADPRQVEVGDGAWWEVRR